MELSKNHVLQGGKYRIIEKIGQGGFAITYKANFATEVTGTMGKITTDVTVAIKEFFFADYCVRDSDNSFITVSSPTGNQIFGKFKEKLRKEATILSRLRHPNIVSVFDIFEENNTIYMVMEYIDGFSLKQTIINQGGHLNEATTLRYASQLCEAVAEIHRNNVLHLDIKPGNILIDNNDNVKLIDFGISKQYNSETHTETSTTPVGISKGFAPLEQYTGVSQFSPATDIYAIGATIYNMLSGQIPPESMYLLEEDLPHINGVSNQMWTAVTSAMQTRRNQRPQSVKDFQSLLLLGQVPIDNNSSTISEHQLTDNNDRTIIQHSPNKTTEETFNLEQIYNVSEPVDSDTTPSSIISGLSTSQDIESTIISNPSQQLPKSPNDRAQVKYEKPKLTIIEDENNLNNKTNRKKILIPIIIIIPILIYVITLAQEGASTETYFAVDSVATCDTSIVITPGQEIDLGLPSGIIWAGWNVGAESAEQSGEFYAFGETETKEIFTDNNFIGYENVPSSISETQYDVARKKWGENWRMPTKTELEELINHCSWENVYYNGVQGYKVTGPNGNSIFLPENGTNVYDDHRILYSHYLSGDACYELSLSDMPELVGGCAGGKRVRPVKSY